MGSQFSSRSVVVFCVVIAACTGEVKQAPRVGEHSHALGQNLLADGSFEDYSPRSLNPDDPTPWFGEEPNHTFTVSGDALSGTQFSSAKEMTLPSPAKLLMKKFRYPCNLASLRFSRTRL